MTAGFCSGGTAHPVTLTPIPDESRLASALAVFTVFLIRAFTRLAVEALTKQESMQRRQPRCSVSRSVTAVLLYLLQ